MKIGYLGPEASFTFSAASQAFPNEELISYQSIPACIRAVKQGKIPWAVVPIENTIEGSVHSTLDQLYHEADIPVQAEIVLPIQQQFMVHKSRANSWQKITKIISHPQAIAQSQAFLEEYFPNAQIEVAPSTAYGAQMVSEHPEEAIAAIGPISGASKYQLQIVAENIQDLKINQTRDRKSVV